MTLVYKQIIVAIDGSKESEWAFKKAVAIAGQNDAALNLVNIVDTRSYSSAEAYDRSIAESAQKSAEELLYKYKAEAVQPGVQNVNVIVTSPSRSSARGPVCAPRAHRTSSMRTTTRNRRPRLGSRWVN